MEEKTSRIEVKKRLRYSAIKILTVACVGLLYFLLVTIFKVGLPCPIHAVTGKFCPGCGISRMCVSMLRLDFPAAYRSNRLLFILLPFFFVYLAGKEWIYIRRGSRNTGKIETAVLALVTAALLVFGVLRNMEAFDYLQPMMILWHVL